MQRTDRHRGRLPKALAALAVLLVGAAGLLTGTPAASAASATPKYRAYVFTFNMCGSERDLASKPACRGDIFAEITKNVEKYQPVAFALQEVCYGQDQDVVAKLNQSATLKAKGLTYVSEYQDATKWMGPTHCPQGWAKGWGNAVIHLGPKGNQAAGTLVKGYYEAQTWTGSQRRSYVCDLVQPYRLWFCSTHLDETPSPGIRNQEAVELEKLTNHLWVRHSPRYPVVVGGDFNQQPNQGGDSSAGVKAMLNSSYSGGTGIFREGALRADRSFDKAELTMGDKKFDYVFVTPDVTVLDTYPVAAKSDHSMLVNRITFG